jgi:SAM-dependent methyltransferase
MSLSDAARNRELWNRDSDEYQGRHRDHIGRPEPRWGIWQIPESELQILGDVAGKDVLELGCGAGQWSILLALLGARTVGIDSSERQLEHARKAMADAGVDFPLVHGNAEALPFPDATFDVVFADHGANRFADPVRWVPEAARVLRPGGLLAFSGATPWEYVCWDGENDTIGRKLVLDYFGLHRLEDTDGCVQFELTYGEWIRLFLASGFSIEALQEIQPPEGATSTYRTPEETEWARHWPMEQIWRVRKE